MGRHRDPHRADGGTVFPTPGGGAGLVAVGRRGCGRRGCGWGAVFLLALAGLWAAAGTAETRVDWLFPPGGRVGTAFEVRLAGQLSAWPLAVWTEEPELHFEATAAPGHFQVTLGTNATPGPLLIRFVDPAAASVPCQFVVGRFPEWTWPEAAPATNAPPAGQAGFPEHVTPPATLQGRLDGRGHEHVWLLNLPGPATVRLEAVASRLDSPGTVRLELADASGTRLGWSTNRPPADPVLECLVPQAGLCPLRVSAVLSEGLSGSVPAAPVIYRVTVTTHEAGRAAAALPAGAWMEGAPWPDAASRVVLRELPVVPEPVLHPETLSPTTDFAGTFGGFINPAGDQDRFGFQTRRELGHRFQVRAVNPGSSFLPVLRVLAADGAVLAESVPGPETVLEWTAPADGAYVLAVADAADSGGPDFGYELEISPPQPRLVATAPTHTLRLPPGGRLTLPVQVRRPDTLRSPLTVATFGLPAGVQAGHAILAPDADTVALEWQARDETPRFSGPVRVWVMDPLVAPPRTIAVTAPLLGRHAPPGGLLINETGVFWLTVGESE